MQVSPLTLRHQTANLAMFGKIIVSAVQGPSTSEKPATPGTAISQTIGPRPDALINEYIQWSGADASKYDGVVPPHMFPQWAFPLMNEAMGALPYKITGILNQGCRLQVNARIPRYVPLNLTAQLMDIDDDGFKARIHVRIVTGTSEHPEALVADVYTVVMLKRKKGEPKPEEDLSAFMEVGSWSAALQDGRNFAFLTGDLNPIHWIGPYAKIAGFKRPILHGFGSLTRSYEMLETSEGKSIKEIDIRFVKPLVLPAKTTLLSRKGTGKGKTKTADIRLHDAKDGLCMAGTVKYA